MTTQTPIVLVPGLLCTAEVFGPQVAALWPHGPVTIASTTPGESIASIAAAILASAPPRFALVGISMGGYICFEILRQAPERVVKLALLDTSARPDTPEQSSQRRALVAKAGEGDFESMMTTVLMSLMHPERASDARLRELNRRMASAIGIEGFARQQTANIGRIDSRPFLREIAVPTVVLVGDRDQLTPRELAEEIATGIPGARLVVVPECGHASTIEQPDFVNRVLVDWIVG